MFIHSYNRWLRDTQQSAEGIYCILVGNKCDDTNRRMVVKREAEDWAEEEKIEYYEVSAKEGTNVEMVFTRLASKLFLNKREKREKDKLIKLKDPKPKPKVRKPSKQSKCC